MTIKATDDHEDPRNYYLLFIRFYIKGFFLWLKWVAFLITQGMLIRKCGMSGKVPKSRAVKLQGLRFRV